MATVCSRTAMRVIEEDDEKERVKINGPEKCDDVRRAFLMSVG